MKNSYKIKNEKFPQTSVKSGLVDGYRVGAQYFADNRPESIVQRKIFNQIEHAGKNHEGVVQRAINNIGLPEGLKSGIENLSGYSMDDVKVHYNSTKPAELNAHAYTQGTEIHIGSGQEKHLAHEAWHVIQQKQGRVSPTFQMKGSVNVNTDKFLEREADIMGARALLPLRINEIGNPVSSVDKSLNSESIVQGKWVKGPKWMKGAKQWDEILDGVRWYNEDGRIWYSIVNGKAVPPGSLETFRMMEGKAHARPIEEWETLVDDVEGTGPEYIDTIDPFQERVLTDAAHQRKLELQREVEKEAGFRLGNAPANLEFATELNGDIYSLFDAYPGKSKESIGKVFGEAKGQNSGSVGINDKDILSVFKEGNFRERMTLVYNAYTNKKLAHFLGVHFGRDPYTYFDRPDEFSRDRNERRDNPGKKTTDLLPSDVISPPLSEREKRASISKKKLKWNTGSKMFYFDPRSEYEYETKDKLTLAGRSSSAWTMHKIAEDLYRRKNKRDPKEEQEKPAFDHSRVFLANLGWMLPSEDHTLYEIAEAAREWGVDTHKVWREIFKGELPYAPSTELDRGFQAKFLKVARLSKSKSGMSLGEIDALLIQAEQLGLSDSENAELQLSLFGRNTDLMQLYLKHSSREKHPESLIKFIKEREYEKRVHPLWRGMKHEGLLGEISTINERRIDKRELDNQFIRDRKQLPFLKKGVFSSLAGVQKMFDQFMFELMQSPSGLLFFRQVLRPRMMVMTTESYQQLSDILFWRLNEGAVPHEPKAVISYLSHILEAVRGPYLKRKNAAMLLQLDHRKYKAGFNASELINVPVEALDGMYSSLARKEGDPVNTRIKRPFGDRGEMLSPLNYFTVREYDRAELPSQRGIVEESAYLLQDPKHEKSLKAMILSNRKETPLSFGFAGALGFSGKAQVGPAFILESYGFDGKEPNAIIIEKRNHQIYGTLFHPNLLKDLTVGEPSEDVTNRLEDFKSKRRSLKTMFEMKIESATKDGQVNLNRTWVFNWLNHNRLMNHFEMLRHLALGVVRLDETDSQVKDAHAFDSFPDRMLFTPFPTVSFDNPIFRILPILLKNGALDEENILKLKITDKRLYSIILNHYQFF